MLCPKYVINLTNCEYRIYIFIYLKDLGWSSRPGLSLGRLRGPTQPCARFRRDSKMNPGKEEEKDGEGGDEDEVAVGGALTASLECLSRCL